ncbi:von Willebrand factor type A domain-containing protein [Hypoxylon trugodes]|uniref:von Willebrand factor type A domain-containing protein n=1 Tax=Hypoxylon trugodes TaxID=326681 RepID=UPI00219063A6|nr:von Willebrand factor type A domain-containing protein [Hypoxylon trugodes]KAI1387280.1 von Willebrand factor type A domain-containing protein [Hypoxylon trugodes]
MTLLGAGIVWDVREPPPSDLEDVDIRSYLYNYTHPDPQRVPQESPNTPERTIRHVLPPSSISINGRILDDTAKTTVSQVFWNHADTPIRQASYVFPLTSGCTVTSFKCRVGRDSILTAKVHPRKEAQEAFQQAVEKNQVAALLEHNTPEVFTASLGNIPSNTRIEAEITYVALLKRQFSDEKDVWTFTIPTAIANRYGTSPAGVRGLITEDEPDTFTLQLDVIEASEIVEIKSETHKILIDRGPNKGKASSWKDLSEGSRDSSPEVTAVRLDHGGEFLDWDFKLTIETSPLKKMSHPHAWIETHPSLEGQKAMMLAIPPSLMLRNREASTVGEVVFFVDRSGSMHDKIDSVKSSLLFFLKGIPVGWTFNIWSFGSTHRQLWEESQVYSSESLSTALDYVKMLRADMGGTELLRALGELVRSRDLSRPCDVIILTDGQVWGLDKTLALIEKTRTVSQGAMRFFSLGIGDHVSHALVQGIASRGGGYSEIIPKASMGGWEDRLVSMLKAALASHIGTWRLNLNGCEVQDEFLTSPANMQTLNLFQGDRIFLLSGTDSSLERLNEISVETLNAHGGWDSTPTSITALQTPDSTIHSLAVRAILDDFEFPSRGSVGSSSNTTPKLTEARAEELACRFSLASKWTSFFLKKEEPESEEDGWPKYASLPVRHPVDDLDLLQPRGTTRDRKKKRIINEPNNNSSAETVKDQFVCFDFMGEDTTPVMPPRPLRDENPNPSVTPYRNLSRGEIDSFQSSASSFSSKQQGQSPMDESLASGGSMDDFNRLMAGRERTLQRPPETSQSLSHTKTIKYVTSRRSYYNTISEDTTMFEPEFAPTTFVEPQSDSTQLRQTPMVPRSSKKFVADILTYQNFDGSFEIDVCSILGPLLMDAAQEIEAHISKNELAPTRPVDVLARTIVIVLLFERDLQEYKDLWDLMIMKSYAYLWGQISDQAKKSELLEFAKAKLVGKELPLSKVDRNQMAESIQNPNPKSHPERSMIRVAPRD